MTQSHHPDYDALIHNHGASLLNPHGGHAPPQHGAPAHGQPPQHAMVPLHEVHSVLSGVQRDLQHIKANQQQPQHAPPSHHAPLPHVPRAMPRHSDGYYDDEQRHEAREERRERRRPRREAESEPTHRSHYDSDTRQFPIGFTKEAIAAGATDEIEVKPQVQFKGNRLAVAASAARYFSILDIKVGKDSQLAATGELPAEAFSSLAVGTRMELDIAEPGIVITIIVKNLDSNPQDFRASLYGEVWER